MWFGKYYANLTFGIVYMWLGISGNIEHLYLYVYSEFWNIMTLKESCDLWNNLSRDLGNIMPHWIGNSVSMWRGKF